LAVSPYINRFLQPDTLIPNLTNPQSLNRFSYVLNNPIRYNDPTGHAVSCDAEVDCKEVRADDKLSLSEYVNKKLSKYKVKLSDGFSNTPSIAILSAVVKVGEKFASERGLGELGSTAFRAVLGYINFKFEGAPGVCGKDTGVDSGGCTRGKHDISFWSMTGQLYNDLPRMTKNVVHELGHAYFNQYSDGGKAVPGLSRDALIRNQTYADGERIDWEQHPISMNADGNDRPNELFADTFIAWTYGAWNPNPNNPLSVPNAQAAMNGFPK